MNRTDAIRLVDDLLTDQRADAWGEPLPTGMPTVAELVDMVAVVGRVFEVHDDGRHVLHEWATLDQITAVAEQHPLPQLPTVDAEALPCPEWCDRPAGHPFEQYATTARREHVHRFSDRGASGSNKSNAPPIPRLD